MDLNSLNITYKSSDASSKIYCGSYPDVADEPLFAIGNGTSSADLSNALTVDENGQMVFNNHTSAVGNIVAGTVRTSLTLASASPKYLARVNLTDGVWILIGSVTFPSNINGCRRIVIDTTPNSNGTGIQIPAYSRNSDGANPYKIRIQTTNFANVNVGYNSDGEPNVLKYYLTANQNSGSILTAEAVRLWAIRIC